MTQITKAQVLDQVQAALGFVPNLMSGIAEQNPAVVAAYLAAGGALESGVLSAAERQVVMLAVSALNECHYCVQRSQVDEPFRAQARRAVTAGSGK